MFPEDVAATGADIILANTYHLMLRPGAERIAKLGGLHQFMHWDEADPYRFRRLSGDVSGQAAAHRRGAASPSSRISTAPRVELTPERAIEVQCLLGADIQMVLDECTPFPATRDEAERSLALSLRWAERSQGGLRRACGARSGPVRHRAGQRLSRSAGAKRQRADRHRLRRLCGRRTRGWRGAGARCSTWSRWQPRSCRRTGPAISWASARRRICCSAIARGIDMFDCVMPTRSGRHCQAFTWGGRLNLRNARYAEDPTPLDAESACPAARYSRAYLHHLVRSGRRSAPCCSAGPMSSSIRS